MWHAPEIRAVVVIFGLLWVGLAWNPIDRQTWLLENILVVLGFVMLWTLSRTTPFSKSAILSVLLFLSLHTIGAHFTYSMVPYDEAWVSLGGDSINQWMDAQRNHYDRLVHFAYGALLVMPLRELMVHRSRISGFWSWFLPFNVILSTSACYELIEWGAAEVFGGELGAAFLGMQGDEWDAQRDMALAALGAALVISLQKINEWRSLSKPSTMDN